MPIKLLESLGVVFFCIGKWKTGSFRSANFNFYGRFGDFSPALVAEAVCAAVIF